MNNLLIAASTALISLSLPAAATTLATFGDSLSDSGNAQAAVLGSGGTWPTELYPNGQFTNGDAWTTQLGLSPSLLGGTNFAFGGAQAVENGDSRPDLINQIDSYLASGIKADVVTVWAGGNDFLALPDNPSEKIIRKTISNVIGAISHGVRALTRSGVDEVFVFGLPDFGRLPEFAGDPLASAKASAATMFYNDLLQQKVAFLDGKRSASIRYVDINGFFTEILAMVPAHLASVPCVADPVGCAANPENYFFYDTVHPSAWVHSLFAERAAREFGLSGPSEVPLPASAPLLLAAFGALAVHRRRSRSVA